MLNWDEFANLPGGSTYNFEMLCRIIIHHNCGQFGHFAALASQPGVEFHLKLEKPCPLGKPEQWYGWQCRWYDLPSGHAIGTTRRNKIIEAIETTERVLPDITDWVLWTRYPLTERDQKWFFSLGTHMKLHLWTVAEVEEYLSGEAEIFRSTYFGELILTPETLSNIHKKSIAPIKLRWQPEVHQTIKAERALRQMLGEPIFWNELQDLANQIKTDITELESYSSDLPQPLIDNLKGLVEIGSKITNSLIDAYLVLHNGDLDLLLQQLSVLNIVIPSKLIILPRQLRAGRFCAAISATNLLSDIRNAHNLLIELNYALNLQLIAIHADAGCGKTELAAQITMGLYDRVPGILIHGRDLSAGNSLDDLAHRIVILGKPVSSMDALLAAVDSAGRRAHRRLPIVIDGLNEAEDPRDWKRLLASLNEGLHLFPYVLFICTIRTAFIDEALPDGINQLDIRSFEEDTTEAIRRYFNFYHINPTDALIDLSLLRHPLTLRIFCEATNPKRDQDVGIEAMPGSLTGLFDRYLEQASERVAELAPRSHRFHEMDIRDALNEIGKALWEEKTRSLDLSSLRSRIGDEKYSWGDSVVRALECDGILIHANNERGGPPRFSVIYDLLAGHIIADSIITQFGQISLETWLKNPDISKLLTGAQPDRHPLATDIFQALVGLIPRRLHHQQLWPLLEEPSRTEALRQVINLEGAYIDTKSVTQLLLLASKSIRDLEVLFSRLKQTRGATDHPLNSDFLDAVLRPMSVSKRDLVWTEWTRRYRDELYANLKRLEEQWRNGVERNSADKLRARWVIWVLTSTVRKLRDLATSTLYWFGRGDPSALFELTIDALAINDFYIPERLLAASYGVVMAHQIYDSEFTATIAPFISELCNAFTGSNATHPTNHWLARLYIQGIVTFAHLYYPGSIPEGFRDDGIISFSPGALIEPIDKTNPKAHEVDQTLHMDFENYTVGSLFEDRGNYHMEHIGYQAALDHIRGTIWNLGWRESEFGVIEHQIMQYNDRIDRSKVERYGKKYSWIGFYTYAGLIADNAKLPQDNERLSEVDIDPSFPELPPPIPISIPNWTQPTILQDELWIKEGKIEIPDDLLYKTNIESHPGPWIATYGFLTTNKQALGRRVIGFLSAVLVSKRNVNTVHSLK